MIVTGPPRFASLLLVLPMLLCAQLGRQRERVPLKNWPAPLYWQPAPTSIESGAVAPVPNASLSATANPLVFVAMPPCRIVDTRSSSLGVTAAFGPPSLLGGASRTFAILS